MSEPAPAEGEPGVADRPPRRTSLRLPDRTPWWLLLGVVAGVVALIALAYAGVTLLNQRPTATPPVAQVVPEAELDRRWGTYLSEREWGTPREAVGTNGWGLTWSRAIGTDYRFSDDGIAGITDLENEFRLSWAFWDGLQDHVTERFDGWTNPQGPAGEAIREDRVYRENTPRHAYSRMTYSYPFESPAFQMEIESARADSSSMTLVVTATNVTTETRTVDVVLRAAMAPGSEIDPIQDGLLMRGAESVVAIVGHETSEWQITPDKGALDVNLRAGQMGGDLDGHIAALAYRLEIPARGASVIRIGVAEAGPPEPPLARVVAANQAADDPAERATAAAAEVLAASDGIIAARRDEADALYTGAVTEHEPLYRSALMSLLWSEAYYRWDGSTGVNPAWAGRVDAHDVLIMPDRWEFPWLASWDTAFQAVTASLADPDVAKDQLRFVLSGRWAQPDGHIPCGEWVMDLECPPVMAWAVARVYEVSNDREFLEEVYPALQRNYDYWWTKNQVGDALFTGGFLGMDNLPRAPTPSAQADATAWMAAFAGDMAGLASELGDNDASERYFLDRGRIQAALNASLWDDQTGFYYDLNSSGTFIRHKSYTGLIPLVAGVVPPERLPTILAALRDEGQFLSVGGVRSLSAASPIYKPGTAGRGVNSNWQGPVWLPINYRLVQALAEVDPALAADIRQRVVENVEADWERTSRFREFYDGDTGAGLGADFQTGWTALVANLIIEGWPAPPAE